MKKIFIIFALAFSHFFTMHGQGKDKFEKLFDKYQEVEGITSIKIAKPMFGMLSNLNFDDSELDQIKPLLSKINGLKILITENPENSNSVEGKKIQHNISQLTNEISSYLKGLNYNEIMSVKNGESRVKFMSSDAKDGMLDDLLLSINSGSGENILVMLDGKLSMDDVNNLINANETKVSTSAKTNVRTSFASENNSSYLNGESRNAGEFSGIEVSTGVNVVFKQENPTSVKVIADADKLQYVITKVENGILKVYIDNKKQKNIKFKNLSVNISSPRLESVKTSSGANFTAVSAIRERNLNIDASSGSTVNGKFDISNTASVEVTSGSNVKASINSASIMVKGSSGSNTNVEGNAARASFDISSGAVCKAENLKANDVEAQSTSGGNLSVNVNGRFKVRASSGGSVKYKGNPELDSSVDKISGGSLKQIN